MLKAPMAVQAHPISKIYKKKSCARLMISIGPANFRFGAEHVRKINARQRCAHTRISNKINCLRTTYGIFASENG
jgi:hypothetical protein